MFERPCNSAKFRRCNRCGITKPLTDFHNCKRRKHGKSYTCVDCIHKYYRTYNVQRQYNVNLDEYSAYYALKLQEQQGYCALCGVHCSEKLLVLDHNHTVLGIKGFRGLLCEQCNLTLGLVHDNINELIGMVDYLKKYNVEEIQHRITSRIN